jgi:hypothetical protein
MAGAGACAIMVTAGCGSVHYQGAATTGNQGHTAAATGPPTISAAQAQRLARDVLARVELPPGARVRAGAAPGSLSQAPSSESGTPDTTVHQLWTAGEPAAAVLRWWAGHVPAGMAWTGSGNNSDGVQFVGYGLKRLPTGVNAATLVMSVESAGPDASVIRADVQVVWYPPRSAAEQIPSGVRAVTVTATTSSPHPVTRTSTSASVLRRLASMLNGVHAAPGGLVFSCPLLSVSYRIAFASAPKAAPFLVMSDTGCQELAVTASGHPQPALEIPAGLGALLQSLTGVQRGPGTSVMHPA